MRESNFAFPPQNRACVCITSQLYDRRGRSSATVLVHLFTFLHFVFLIIHPLLPHEHASYLQHSTQRRHSHCTTRSHTSSISPPPPHEFARSSPSTVASNALSASSATFAQTRRAEETLHGSTHSRPLARLRPTTSPLASSTGSHPPYSTPRMTTMTSFSSLLRALN